MSYFTDLAHQYIDGRVARREAAPGTSSTSTRTTARSSRRSRWPPSRRSTRPTAPPSAPAGLGRDQSRTRAGSSSRRALALIEDREQEIAEAIIAELGGTRLKAAFELHLAKEFLREAIQLALRPEGRILPSPVDGKENRVYRVPVGVVGVISPFNFPFLLSIKSVAPALALGNAVVLKPHQNTPDRAAAPWSRRSSRTRVCPPGCSTS